MKKIHYRMDSTARWAICGTHLQDDIMHWRSLKSVSKAQNVTCKKCLTQLVKNGIKASKVLDSMKIKKIKG